MRTKKCCKRFGVPFLYVFIRTPLQAFAMQYCDHIRYLPLLGSLNVLTNRHQIQKYQNQEGRQEG